MSFWGWGKTTSGLQGRINHIIFCQETPGVVETPNLGVSTNHQYDIMMTMEKFENKYRIPSARLPNWDYGWNAAYFVTICTKNREHYFGEIITVKEEMPNVETPNLGVSTTNQMELSPIGKLAENYWLEIPQHFPFVKLDAFVVMPNHLHGIIIIDKPVDRSGVETPNLGVSTSMKWKPGTLGVIINQYKRICTIHARIIQPDFAWQSRYYDHIIRDEKSYHQIAEYIIHNPLKWPDDRYYV